MSNVETSVRYIVNAKARFRTINIVCSIFLRVGRRIIELYLLIHIFLKSVYVLCAYMEGSGWSGLGVAVFAQLEKGKTGAAFSTTSILSLRKIVTICALLFTPGTWSLGKF